MNVDPRIPKASVDEIRRRFDADVERFSNVETGQSATMDAPLVLDLITRCAASVGPQAKTLLDVGCGAGNYSIKILERLPGLDITLVDLSAPMLERAQQRLAKSSCGKLEAIQGDIREVEIGEDRFDVILGGAVLHHLRGDDEWVSTFRKLHRALKEGGALFVSDLVEHENSAINATMWDQYGRYLTDLKGEAYRDQVFDYIQREDSPRPLTYQLDLLRQAGFRYVDVLHKRATFAAYCAIK